jgi:CHRD domain
MDASTAAAPGRRGRAIAAIAVTLAALTVALASPPRAAAACENPFTLTEVVDCFVPITGTYTMTVPLSAATQTATGIAGDGSATGSTSLTLDADTNTVCATTSWSGVSSPVVFGHIHAGAYGQPENPAVTISLFNFNLNGVQSPASGCSLAPPGEIGLIVKCPQQFNIVIHSQKHPVGAIRGQLGTTCTA